MAPPSDNGRNALALTSRRNLAAVGSVKAPAESSTEQNDQQEEAALVDLATVAESQARDAAGQAVAGTVGQAEIEQEDGYVVYDVEVTQSNGDQGDNESNDQGDQGDQGEND